MVGVSLDHGRIDLGLDGPEQGQVSGVKRKTRAGQQERAQVLVIAHDDGDGRQPDRLWQVGQAQGGPHLFPIPDAHAGALGYPLGQFRRDAHAAEGLAAIIDGLERQFPGVAVQQADEANVRPELISKGIDDGGQHGCGVGRRARPCCYHE